MQSNNQFRPNDGRRLKNVVVAVVCLITRKRKNQGNKRVYSAGSDRNPFRFGIGFRLNFFFSLGFSHIFFLFFCVWMCGNVENISRNARDIPHSQRPLSIYIERDEVKQEKQTSLIICLVLHIIIRSVTISLFDSLHHISRFMIHEISTIKTEKFLYSMNEFKWQMPL